jgi:hypothetical protein
MSSQGDPGLTGYTYQPTRDASDRTRQIKEALQYKTQKSSYVGNTHTEPIWMKYGNQFKLTYDFGKLECTTCISNAFGGIQSTVGGS